MLKFVRYADGQIRNLTLKKRSTKQEMRKFYEDGIRFIFEDANSNQDLLPEFVESIDDGTLQIELQTVKFRKCRDCNCETVNYFRCGDCWQINKESRAS